MKYMKNWLIFPIVLAALILTIRGHADSAASMEQYNKDMPRGLPNIPARAENSGEFDLFAEFLAWFASQETASVWTNVFSVGFNTSTFEAKNFDFDWDYGFRLGAGYNFAYDQWDAQLYWTWFRTENRDSVSSKSEATVIPEFEAGLLSGRNANSASIHWMILMNMMDWELGRKYWVSRDLSMRPFIGFKGGWIDHHRI